jgi:hypothetical protein
MTNRIIEFSETGRTRTRYYKYISLEKIDDHYVIMDNGKKKAQYKKRDHAMSVYSTLVRNAKEEYAQMVANELGIRMHLFKRHHSGLWESEGAEPYVISQCPFVDRDIFDLWDVILPVGESDD